MRITKPCAGDDPFKIEGSIEQHELLLSDMSLAPPDKDGKCRRLYNRQGEQCHLAASPHCICQHSQSPCRQPTQCCPPPDVHETWTEVRQCFVLQWLTWCSSISAAEHQDNLFGDINMVNGIPWPVMTIQAKYHRFRVRSSVPSCIQHQSR
jgi:hypothetical protein